MDNKEKATKIAETIYTLMRLQYPGNPIGDDPNLYADIQFSISTHLDDFDQEEK